MLTGPDVLFDVKLTRPEYISVRNRIAFYRFVLLYLFRFDVLNFDVDFALYFIGFFPWNFARCPCVWLKKVAAGD